MSFPTPQHAVAAADEATARGAIDAALDVYRRALQRWPGHPGLLFNLGSMHSNRGDFAAAAACLADVVKAVPGFAPAHHNLGQALSATGERDRAALCYVQALALDAGLVASRIALAREHLRTGKPEPARAVLEMGLQKDPRQADLWTELGLTYAALGAQTLEMDCHRRALALRPDSALAVHNLSAALHAAGQFDEALPLAQRAVALAPQWAAAQENLGNVLAHQGALDEARQALASAAQLEGLQGPRAAGLAWRSAMLVQPVAQSVEQIQRSRALLQAQLEALALNAGQLEDPVRDVGSLSTFYLAYQGLPNRGLMQQLAALYRQASPALNFSVPAERLRSTSRGGRIRVGFVSRYFCNHTVGRYLLGLVQHLTRPEFEVCLLTWPRPADPLSRAFDAAADEVRFLPTPLPAMQQAVADAALDVIIFADIGMEPASYFLAFSRLAPVQCAFYGHPDTTGLDTIDHFISWAAAETAASPQWYSEALALLPADCTYAHLPRPGELPKPATKPALGLSAQDRLYLCVQAPYKLHPEFDDLVAGVLQADAQARVALVRRGAKAWNDALLHRMQQRLGADAARLHLLPERGYADYLSLLGAADVVLDTPHFSGGATSLDAIMMAVPVVTLQGPVLRSNQTRALFQRMGVEDGNAVDGQDYVRRAVRIGTDVELRQSLTQRIQSASPLLFEDTGMVRAFESMLLGWVSAPG